MTYLITGITGFAGPHLANLLHDNGHQVHGLIRGSNGMETDILDVVPESVFKDIHFVYGDLKDFRSMQKVFQENVYDGVFHLAAQSHPPTSFTDPLETFDTNVTGTANLIQCIADFQPSCKLMFCSTSEVYGNVGRDGRKIKTTDTIMPANPYGASKAAIDLYMQERMTNGKRKGFITRAFSHTGPRRGKNFSISSDAFQIAKMKIGLQDDKLLVGNLESVRVVLDVRDIVNAYYLLMINPDSHGKVFNVSGDKPYKMQHYTDLLIQAAKLSTVQQVRHEPFWRPHDIHYQHGDCSDLISLTNWAPKIKLETTMNDLLNYWIEKLSANVTCKSI